jgi:hypothetical protein
MHWGPMSGQGNRKIRFRNQISCPRHTLINRAHPSAYAGPAEAHHERKTMRYGDTVRREERPVDHMK